MFPLELPEQGQRLQPRVEGQSLGDAGPDVGERVRVGAPGMRHPYLAGERPSRRYLRAVLGSMPDLTAATRGGVPCTSSRRNLPNLLIGGEHAEPLETWVRSA